MIEKTVVSSSAHIILGDLNVKAEVQSSSDAMSLGDFLEIFNLQNHVSFSTHDKGHTLDLILADVNNKVVREVSQGNFIGDHYFIECQLDVCKPQKETQTRQYCNVKKMDKEKFQEGLVNLFSSIHIETTTYCQNGAIPKATYQSNRHIGTHQEEKSAKGYETTLV